MRIVPLVSLGLASLGLADLVATAADAAARRSHPPRYEEAAPLVAPVELCEPLCPQDFSPCDPINFKIADARCAQVGVGR